MQLTSIVRPFKLTHLSSNNWYFPTDIFSDGILILEKHTADHHIEIINDDIYGAYAELSPHGSMPPPTSTHLAVVLPRTLIVSS